MTTKNKFNIIPMPRPKDNNDELDPILPPLHTLFIGSTGSGKTNLILNMVLRNRMFGYLNYYKKIYILSPSSCFDNTFDIVNSYIDTYCEKRKKKGLAEIELFDEYNDEILEKIIEEIQSDYVPNGDRTLVLLDDCINELQSNISSVQMLFTRGRHMKISVWISSQAYKKVPKVLRTNSIDIIIFSGSSKREIKDLWEEFGTDSLDEFYKLYKEYTKEKYSFLQIRTRYSESRYIKNFNK